jgi:hypothetical protein
VYERTAGDIRVGLKSGGGQVNNHIVRAWVILQWGGRDSRKTTPATAQTTAFTSTRRAMSRRARGGIAESGPGRGCWDDNNGILSIHFGCGRRGMVMMI